MAANLDGLSHGRFVLGLGLGWNEREHAAYDLPFPPPRERARLLEAGLVTIRRTLPARVPVLIGGMGRGSLGRVARHADEWNLTTSSPEVYARLSRSLADACQAVGRDPTTIRRSVSVGILVGQDAAELARRGEAMRRLVPGLADVASDDLLPTVRQRGWVAGTPDEVADALRRLADAGVDRAMLGHYDLDDTGVLDLIARMVLPALVGPA
jgi:alkanesulfonate monooxygenase SsuD/methylene tetrahydromethanopterin reductase-like flavin-dependent oxidoreductase (luciferase family)